MPQVAVAKSADRAKNKFFVSFYFLKYRLRNPSHPPFSKGGELFGMPTPKDSSFSPLESGTKGDLSAFQTTKLTQFSKERRGK
jgi:hypothetical protein